MVIRVMQAVAATNLVDTFLELMVPLLGIVEGMLQQEEEEDIHLQAIVGVML